VKLPEMGREMCKCLSFVRDCIDVGNGSIKITYQDKSRVSNKKRGWMLAISLITIKFVSCPMPAKREFRLGKVSYPRKMERSINWLKLWWKISLSIG